MRKGVIMVNDIVVVKVLIHRRERKEVEEGG